MPEISKTQARVVRRALTTGLKASVHDDGTPWGFEWADGKAPSAAACSDLWQRGLLVWQEKPREHSHADVKGWLTPTCLADTLARNRLGIAG